MFKKIFEKYKQTKLENEATKLEKQRNKPEFKLGELYVGEIVLYKKREYTGFGISDYYYNEVKNFAFFTKAGYEKYCHIKSGQMLIKMGAYESIVGDYAINKIRRFEEAFPIFMRKNNLTLSSKVSRAFIEENEDKFNKELMPNKEVVELFR